MSSQRQQRERYLIDDLELDVGQVRVVRDGTEVPLPPLSFRLLLELARAAPDVVRPDDLLDRVWAGVVVNEETLKQRVKLLRQALGESGRKPRYVRTVRGVGYQLIPVVERPGPGPDRALGGRPESDLAAVDRPSWLRRLLRPLGLGAAALTVAALVLALGIDLTTRPAPAAARSPVASPAPAPDSAEALYLAGRSHFVRRGEQSLRRAQSAFRQATMADPSFAAAWAGLSDATLMRLLYGEAEWAATLNEARGYLSQAEQAGGHEPVVQTSLGLLAWTEGRTGDAEALFRGALAMDADNPLSGLWLGILKLRSGDPEAARVLLTRVRALTPTDPVVLTNLGEAHLSLGEYGTGMNYLSLAAQAAPDQGLLALRAVAWALEYGRPATADAWLGRAREAGGDPHGALAALGARTRIVAGDIEGARRLLRQAGLQSGSSALESGPGWAVAAKRSAALSLAVADGGAPALQALRARAGARTVEGWSHQWAAALYLAGDYPAMLRVYEGDGPASGIAADLGPLDRAWVHVSLAVAHARQGDPARAGAHARVAADSLMAHGGREPRVEILKARLAAFQRQPRRVFAALDDALAAGWMDAAVLDRDPVFLPYRSRPEFSALRKVLEGRMRAAREALESGTVSVKVAAAGVSGRAGPDPEVGGLR